MLLDTSAIAALLLGEPGSEQLRQHLDAAPSISVSSVTLLEAQIVLTNRFGKGRHRAALNFGDCIVYAVARHTGLPLLFCGNDFPQTDLAELLTTHPIQ